MTKKHGAEMLGLALLILAGCGDGGKAGGKFATLTPDEVNKTFENKDAPVQTMESGLKYQDIKVGTGAEAEAGKHIYVHYTGSLVNGAVFDSSVKRGSPFDFQLGSHAVIRGWDEGIAGMKEGGKRKLLIPAALGYGHRGNGTAIPPNAELVFEVELLKVQ